MIATAVDAILALVLLEGIGLTLLHRRTGRGPAPGVLWPNLAAGFTLMLALRLALGDGAIPPQRAGAIALVLLAALVAHMLDLRARWRSDR